MAIAEHRSWNQDMLAGATDGTWKKAVMDRGGIVEPQTSEVRKRMSGVWHGFNETQPKITADGRSVSTPYYQDITPQDSENV